MNELGAGLHSYGFTEGVAKALALAILVQLGIIALGLLPAERIAQGGAGRRLELVSKPAGVLEKVSGTVSRLRFLRIFQPFRPHSLPCHSSNPSTSPSADRGHPCCVTVNGTPSPSDC